MTADENPVIDRSTTARSSPAGLQGHGYKFSCVLGAAVGELDALGAEPSVDLTGFALGRAALVDSLP